MPKCWTRESWPWWTATSLRGKGVWVSYPALVLFLRIEIRPRKKEPAWLRRTRSKRAPSQRRRAELFCYWLISVCVYGCVCLHVFMFALRSLFIYVWLLLVAFSAKTYKITKAQHIVFVACLFAFHEGGKDLHGLQDLLACIVYKICLLIFGSFIVYKICLLVCLSRRREGASEFRRGGISMRNSSY